MKLYSDKCQEKENCINKLRKKKKNNKKFENFTFKQFKKLFKRV